MENWVLTRIDTFEYFGQPRKRYHLSNRCTSDTATWIEGISNVNGSFYIYFFNCIDDIVAYQSGAAYTELNYFFKGDVKLYDNSI